MERTKATTYHKDIHRFLEYVPFSRAPVPINGVALGETTVLSFLPTKLKPGVAYNNDDEYKQNGN